MRIAPLDLRQPKFKTAFRGFDKTEVVAFLTEAADDYEHALREIDRLRQDLSRMEALLGDHREREANLRNTLVTAQRLSDEMKEAAQAEAKMIVREAQGRSDLLLQKAQARLEEVERDINEMRLRRRGVEGSLEASIQSLYHALEFIREQDEQRTARSTSIVRAMVAARAADPVRMLHADLLIRNAREILTCAGAGPMTGSRQGQVSAIPMRPSPHWTA